MHHPPLSLRTRPMSPTDHNLLFGALALQLDFIDRDALVCAVTTWASDKSRPLGEILVEQGHLDRDRHDLLANLAREQGPNGTDRALLSLPSIHTVKEDLARCNDPELNHFLSTIAPPPGSQLADHPSVESALLSGHRFHVRDL